MTDRVAGTHTLNTDFYMQHLLVLDLPNKYLRVIWCNLEILTQKWKLQSSSMYRLSRKGRKMKEEKDRRIYRQNFFGQRSLNLVVMSLIYRTECMILIQVFNSLLCLYQHTVIMLSYLQRCALSWWDEWGCFIYEYDKYMMVCLYNSHNSLAPGRGLIQQWYMHSKTFF